MGRKLNNHIGESKNMNNGLVATVIAHRGTHDIDVQFSDWVIVRNKQYSNFLRGAIKHPAVKTKGTNLVDRTGETRKMKNGLMAKIVKYNNAHDIDVEFENGITVFHKQRHSFLAGEIKCPTVRTIVDHTGEVRTMKNGLKATIIRYGDSQDIDIQFENGGIVTGRAYSNFKSGYVKCPMLYEYFDNYVKVTNPNTAPPFEFLIDLEDVPLLGDVFWFNNSGYASSKVVEGKNTLLHRLIMSAPDSVEIDHINGNRADCRRSNLRVCTRAENNHNKPKNSNNTSGYKGVSRFKQTEKWQAKIMADYEQIHLGFFTDINEAARAYNEAAIKYHGQFARLNDVS